MDSAAQTAASILVAARDSARLTAPLSAAIQ